MTPSEACANKDFCCTLVTADDGNKYLKLQHNHPHFSQVQGQMAITGRTWCDFVIYTEKDISVERGVNIIDILRCVSTINTSL